MSDPQSQKQSLDTVFGTPIGQLLEMDETELRRLLAKAELVCRCSRGALQLKTQKRRGV